MVVAWPPERSIDLLNSLPSVQRLKQATLDACPSVGRH